MLMTMTTTESPLLPDVQTASAIAAPRPVNVPSPRLSGVLNVPIGVPGPLEAANAATTPHHPRQPALVVPARVAHSPGAGPCAACLVVPWSGLKRPHRPPRAATQVETAGAPGSVPSSVNEAAAW